MTHELLGAAFHLGTFRDGISKAGGDLRQQYGSSWYYSRKEIEHFSPSRKDGIDLRKESELRISYSTFLKDFGMRLGVSQVTIATAIMFSHRFYLHQSHAKNDWQTVATACMFLASKVEDTPLSLEKVIVSAYEMIYKKDPATARRIHQKDAFEKQKALVLITERLLLSTVRYDFNIQHPYRPLLHALKKIGMTEKNVRQVAWNFINDSLRTTLCLQYKPHYIAASSLFLAAKLHNVKLPSRQGYVWWHEFDVTPQQLHAAIQEMMELLGYKRRPVVPCAPEKPTQISLISKEASSSPDSCVLSRPGSFRSSSSQCSNGVGGRQKPADLINPRAIRKLNVDVENASVTGKTELQPQATDSDSPDSVIEDSQGSGNGVDRARLKLGQAANIGDCHRSGECMVNNRMKPEQNGDTVTCQVSAEGVDQARIGHEHVASNEDSQESDEGMDQLGMTSEQNLGPGTDAKHLRTPEQVVAHNVGCQGSAEGMDQSRMEPEQIADIVSCCEHGADAARGGAFEQVSENEGCQSYVDSMDQAPYDLEQLSCHGHGTAQTRAGERVSESEGCQRYGDGVDQTPSELEQVSCHGHGEDAAQAPSGLEQFSCSGYGDVTANARTSEQVSKSEGCQRHDGGVDQAPCNLEQVIAADVPRVKTEHDATIEDCQGSGEGLDQTRTKPEEVTDGLNRMDITKAMVERRKRERESPSSVVQVTVADLPRIKLEQVATVEDSLVSGDCLGQTKTRPDKGTDGLSRIDRDRIKAIVNRKRERESVSYLEQVIAAGLPGVKPEQVTIEDCEGSGEDLVQTRTKPRKDNNGLGSIDIDRIKAMRKRKRDGETNKRKEAMIEYTEDAWIEKELETGIEFSAKSTVKKQKLF